MCARGAQPTVFRAGPLQSEVSYLTPTRVRTVASFTVILSLIGIGVLAQAREKDEWHWDDWAAMASAVLLSALFFVLARSLDVDSERRSDEQRKAVRRLSQTTANAQLIMTVGSLQTTGARTLGGAPEQALRVSADSLAALEHFELASEAAARHQLILAIEAAYTNLAFSALSRGTWLPRFMWEQIRLGAVQVQEKLKKIESHHRNSLDESDRESLKGLIAHIECVIRTADRLRRRGISVTALDDNVLVPDLEIGELMCLYRHELAVYHDWRVLTGGHVTCYIELRHATEVARWHTPWYVKRSGDRWEPTNFHGETLNEEAAWDRIETEGSLPPHPQPLRVLEVPPGMRSRGIERMMQTVKQQMQGVVSALVYELADVYEDNLREDQDSPWEAEAEGVAQKNIAPRMILDGNHRALAAFRLARQSSRGDRSDGPFFITYVIKEQAPITAKGCTVRSNQKWTWEGFTPDVEKLRGKFKNPKDMDGCKS